MRSLRKRRERERRRGKKTGRDQTELRFHKKAPRPLLSLGSLSTRAHVRGIYRGPNDRGIARRSPPREAPPNSGSCTRGRIVASPPIGRHVARHCFIHACSTFLVYLVQVAPGPGLGPALLRPGPHRIIVSSPGYINGNTIDVDGNAGCESLAANLLRKREEEEEKEEEGGGKKEIWERRKFKYRGRFYERLVNETSDSRMGRTTFSRNVASHVNLRYLRNRRNEDDAP